MRRSIAVIAITVLAGACSTSAAIEGSGVGGQRSYTVSGFDRIVSAGSYNVVVQVGGQPSVRAEGDEAMLEQLDIRVEDGRLMIGTKQGSWTSSGNIIVHVTLPSLQGVEVAGSGDMQIGAFRTATFEGSVAGSANLVLDGIESDRASFDIAGSGNVSATGRARQAKLDIAGSGSGRLSALQVETAEISIAGSGDAQMRATGTAAVAIMGSGNVDVTGGARCTVSKMGSGEVRCG